MVSDTESKPVVVKAGEPRGVLPPGTRLRAYELLSVLGQGNFGITYRARDTQLDRDVAIKEFLPTSLALREDGTYVVPRSTEHAAEFVWGRERFLEEARTLAKLANAPSIVRVFDFLEDNGTAYTVMALAHGETLEQRLKREGHLPPAGVEHLLQPLLDGLEQVHAIGFLHRDIKPANIIVDERGAPTLIDFGASRSAVATRTGAMTAIFTPGYAAAEQFTSARQGPWTDIYGVSATIYHAVTGTVPPSAFDRMLEDTYQPLSRMQLSGFPPDLLRGIDAGMAVRVSDRPQSIAGWRRIFSRSGSAPSDAVTAVLADARPAPLEPAPWAQPSSAPLPVAPSVQPRVESTPLPNEAPLGRNHADRRRLRALWLGLAIALVALAGAGGYIAMLGRPASVDTALQKLTAEELTTALEERRKADALALEKKRLEEDAAGKAAAEAEAKRRADAELQSARQQRQKAEDELARLKAEIEARRTRDSGQRDQVDAAAARAAEEAAQRKAEVEMAALRQAEVDAQKKAEAEAAAKKQADEALAKAQAERQKADADAAQRATAEAVKRKADDEARQKLEADTRQRTELAAKQSAEAELAAQKKAAEATEGTLRLATPDRQRLQVALTSLGFDTRGTDGTFGPRSREMIAAWQKTRNEPPTGFLAAAQQTALLRAAAAAVGRFDDEQKKVEEEKKKADEEAKRKAAAVAPPASSARPAQPADDNKILEQKNVNATKTSGLSRCGSNFNYGIRVYRTMIQVSLGGAWRTARTDAQGRFDSGEFTNAGNNYRITGDMTQRAFNVDNLTTLCTWRATF